VSPPEADDEVPAALADATQMRTGQMLVRLGGAVAVLLGAVVLIAWLFRDPLEAAGELLVDRAGLAGIGALVVALDPLPGLGFQPGLILGTAADVGWPQLFLTTALGSWASSVLGWALGRWGGRVNWVVRVLRMSGATAAISRWGVRAVALASITPLPFGLATLAAGASGMPLRLLAGAALFRWLKIALSLAAIQLGWDFAG
jgi:membrane protein YqaA with SNARE-associated domain